MLADVGCRALVIAFRVAEIRGGNRYIKNVTLKNIVGSDRASEKQLL
jgi:hypothetical protein